MRQKLIISLIFFVFSGLLFHSGCKTEEEHVYDIRGTWTLTATVSISETFVFTFSGSLTSGTVSCADFTSGTYTVNGNQVNIIMYYLTIPYTFTGTFTNDNYMSGSLTVMGLSGTWVAIR